MLALNLQFHSPFWQNESVQKELNSRALEMDIREHFTMFSDVDIACEHLLKKYQSVGLTNIELDTLGAFCLKLGNSPAYIKFSLHRLNLDLDISWAHLTASLYQCTHNVPRSLTEALLKGATEADRLDDLARTHDMDFEVPENQDRRSERRARYQEEFRERVQDLEAQVEMLRLQELEDDEERVLLELLRINPLDEMAIQQYDMLKERKAVQMLEAKLQNHQTPWDQSEQVALEEAERQALDIILNSMHLQWAGSGFDEQLGLDFTMALFMWDYPEAAIDFLPEQNDSERVRWTRMEAQLQARHFVNLLNELERAERQAAADPDQVFAIMYLKALALWGLGHRFAAVEIMESIASHRPHYRSAMTLLNLWKGGGS